ncbi:hypothetical protein F5Y15DRAFT_430944 [Xylariaceae sp. FL0016]|nr:hypothetical protein F5Y15DRAFT_430944 [Xylariaceae sp. FL0016]
MTSHAPNNGTATARCKDKQKEATASRTTPTKFDLHRLPPELRMMVWDYMWDGMPTLLHSFDIDLNRHDKSLTKYAAYYQKQRIQMQQLICLSGSAPKGRKQLVTDSAGPVILKRNWHGRFAKGHLERSTVEMPTIWMSEHNEFLFRFRGSSKKLHVSDAWFQWIEKTFDINEDSYYKRLSQIDEHCTPSELDHWLNVTTGRSVTSSFGHAHSFLVKKVAIIDWMTG